MSSVSDDSEPKAPKWTIAGGVDTTVVDSEDALEELLDSLNGLPTDPPSLYLDFHWLHLRGRDRLSIIALYVLPEKKAYLIDTYELKKRAFTISIDDGLSLKKILQSRNIPKVVCGIRHPSSMLLETYGVTIRGVKDMQLTEAAVKAKKEDPDSDESEYGVASLVACIEKDGLATVGEKAVWQHMKGEFEGLDDGCGLDTLYRIFFRRPIAPVAVQFWAKAISLLPGLYEVYMAELRRLAVEDWQNLIDKATRARIEIARSESPSRSLLAGDCGLWDRGNLEEAIEKCEEDGLLSSDDEEEDSEEEDGEDGDEEEEEEYFGPKIEYMSGLDQWGRKKTSPHARWWR